jgi:hypothetical protein
MTRLYSAHPANCEGPFYVVSGECMGCGAPESEAAGMISHDDTGHCFFMSQPRTADQTDSAIRALWSSCCGAVRYAGNDRAILSRIAQLGVASSSDKELSPSPPTTVRNRVTFMYRSASTSFESSLREIVRFVADSRPNQSGCKCSDFDYGKNEGSFIFHWGTSDFPNSIRFRIERSTGDKWLISIEDNDRAKIGTAMSLDTALQASDSFAEIRWFTEDEEDGRDGTGADHPY